MGLGMMSEFTDKSVRAFVEETAAKHDVVLSPFSLALIRQIALAYEAETWADLERAIIEAKRTLGRITERH